MTRSAAPARRAASAFARAGCAALGLGLAPGPAAADVDVLARLRAEGRLGDREWRALDRGEVVAKALATDDRSEVFSYSGVRVDAPAARVASLLHRLEGREGEPWTLQIGGVSEPASPRDFSALTLDAGEVRALSRCRVNDCAVRLPGDAIRRFRQALDPLPPGERAARADALFRDMLGAYAAGYQQRGDVVLFEYANNDDPVRIADSLALVLSRWTLVADVAPGLAAHARGGSAALPPDASAYLYWTRQRFWLLDVLSLSEVTVADRASPAGRTVIALRKQLYATHYYESALGLTVFVETGPDTGCLFLLDRARADIRRSGFTWVERLLLDRLVRRRAAARLGRLKEQLERAASR